MPTRQECRRAGFIPGVLVQGFGFSARQQQLNVACSLIGRGGNVFGGGRVTKLSPDAPATPLPEARPRTSGKLPQCINAETDVCQLIERWLIDPRLAVRLVVMASKLPFPISIISGYRSPEEQAALTAQGRPTAPLGRSTHTSCPSTGADLRVGLAVTRTIQARFGLAAVESGLRWGGGSPVDPQTGIPSDWNHVDLGPR